MGEGKYVKVKVILIYEFESFFRDLCCYVVVDISWLIVFVGMIFLFLLKLIKRLDRIVLFKFKKCVLDCCFFN